MRIDFYICGMLALKIFCILEHFGFQISGFQMLKMYSEKNNEVRKMNVEANLVILWVKLPLAKPASHIGARSNSGCSTFNLPHQ